MACLLQCLPAPFRNVLIVYNTRVCCLERAAGSTAPLIHFLISAYIFIYHLLTYIVCFFSYLISSLFPYLCKDKRRAISSPTFGRHCKGNKRRPTSAVILIVLHAMETRQFRDRRWSVILRTSGRPTVTIVMTSKRPTAAFFLIFCAFFVGCGSATQQASHCVGYSSDGVFGQTDRLADVTAKKL